METRIIRQDGPSKVCVAANLLVLFSARNHEAIDAASTTKIIEISGHRFVMFRSCRRSETTAAAKMTIDILGLNQVLDVVEHLCSFLKHRYGFGFATELDQLLDAKLLIAAPDLPTVSGAGTEPWHPSI